MAKDRWEPRDKDKVYSPRQIKYDPYGVVPVDILIPFHGQYQKVYDLCKSLWKTLGLYHNYNICLIDDASPNEHFLRGFEKAPRTTILRSEERLGFGGALNVGFENTERPFVLILHSDCVAEHHSWLKSLFETWVSFREQKVGLVAPLTNNPVTGPDCLRMDKAQFFGGRSRKDFILEEGCIPLYCALAPREVFRYINGFVKSYPVGWYEDEELTHRMRSYGFKLGVSGKSWIYHKGGATVDTLLRDEPELKETMEANRDRCILDIQHTKRTATDVAARIPTKPTT